MSISRFCRAACLIAFATALGACTLNTMPRAMPIIPAPGDTDPAPAEGMAGAEAACTQAGRERGLDVLGVVSTRDVTGADGSPERDVMLQVARSDTRLEVRCNYQPETGVARIMLI
ncbi:MAG: UPF0126 domain [Roseibaca calidilacus]|uniref:UPF0126 domain n=1 Tax=Roseibaca calidilacus TaxID=1666912 RepID=A0A0P7YRM1_9RHOB|nr:hypothetical protein [Roseibaca calidilacus]KPP91844.1 MAG: UPF0126 domain [Roseibaca calidilacus]CUX82421.1 hypothetical protein Ga0058931_2365 [Roseibaca calidilacus]